MSVLQSSNHDREIGDTLNGSIRPTVLIVGAPRSGTYLLVSELEKLFSIVTPLETHFVPLFQRYLSLWGDLSIENNRRAMLADIFLFLKIWARASRVDTPELAAYNLLAVEDRFEEIVAATSSFNEVVSALFYAYAELHDAQRSGEKSAFYSPMPTELTAGGFRGDVKVLHIIRDGRDVASSWMNMWTGPDSLVAAARLWRSHVIEKARWGSLNPGHYLEVKYEDYLTNSDQEILRIAEFLDTDVDERTSEEFAKALSGLETHTKLKQGLLAENAYKWRQSMEPRDVRKFEFFAGDVLHAKQYEVGSSKYRTAEKIYYLLSLIPAFTKAVISRKRWRYVMKNQLPLFIWLSRKLRFQSLISDRYFP